MSAGENGGENLLDHVGLADNDFLQLFLHQFAMLAEFLQYVAETTWLGGRQGQSFFVGWGSGRTNVFIVNRVGRLGTLSPQPLHIVQAIRHRGTYCPRNQ
jgi:hypothetical protein